MADLSNLKKRSTLGAPPSPDEASENLSAPELAPASVPDAAQPRQRRDGRSARRTNRTLPFSTRVSPEFDDRLRDVAERDGLMLCELLERALESYERERAPK
ncbi:hypothetical protein [Methylobacterium soli]|uniref:Stability/partitioning determinant n=1 Tax=Methylobacterium soli TaxID=553447 RepID=A0A6L3SWT9_9HYPH|nr:hypothetical protein [Methylobacterium soli]KAB1078368.1 hypothetical protein F6X53_14865 [Methylobacterium soli]GJE41130.1 hypothetical protein AEGHOMDF_0290 [Methylobacterium soli]